MTRRSARLGGRLLGGLSLLAALGFAACERRPAPEGGQPRSAGIAKLLEVKADVKHRPASELGWSAAREGMSLASRDSVQTGDDSSAVVHFNAETKVVVSPKTLLMVLEPEPARKIEQSVLALPSGRVESRMSADNARPVELVVKTKKGWIRATGKSNFTAQVGAGGALEVENRGEALKLVTAEGEREIAREQKVAVAGGPSGSAESDLTELVASRSPPRVEIAAIRVVSREQAPTKPAQAQPAPAAARAFRLDSPRHKSAVATERVRVAGVLAEGQKIFLNGDELASGGDGRFASEVPLQPGLNILTFQITGPREEDVQYVTREVTRK